MEPKKDEGRNTPLTPPKDNPSASNKTLSQPSPIHKESDGPLIPTKTVEFETDKKVDEKQKGGRKEFL